MRTAIDENDVQPPTFSATYKERSVDAILKSIPKSVPDDIKVKLPVAALTETSAQIITKLRCLMVETFEACHRCLEAETNLTQLKAVQQTFEYIGAHRTLRHRMYQ